MTWAVVGGGAVFALLAVWGIWLGVSPKVEERPSEKSSHYESGLGKQGVGTPPWSR